MHSIAARIYEKDPQTLSEVNRIFEKFNEAQQLTATLTPSTANMHGVTAVLNLTTLHRTAPVRSLHQEHHNTKTSLIQGNHIPTTKGTDHTPPTMGTDMGTFQLITIMHHCHHDRSSTSFGSHTLCSSSSHHSGSCCSFASFSRVLT